MPAINILVLYITILTLSKKHNFFKKIDKIYMWVNIYLAYYFTIYYQD
jgi:hypothetical protein